MRKPKLRELKEALTAVISPRFTTQFPAKPCVVPESLRGKPEFDLDSCIGCGACVNVCPTRALTMVDNVQLAEPVRKITARYDACIFCGNCQEYCTTETGIKLTNEWDLAGLDRNEMAVTHDYALQLCERCGAVIGTQKQLQWLYDRLGALAYTNPALLLSQAEKLVAEQGQIHQSAEKEINTNDFMRILCPVCKCQLNLKL